jgi:hypothetical protein
MKGLSICLRENSKNICGNFYLNSRFAIPSHKTSRWSEIAMGHVCSKEVGKKFASGFLIGVLRRNEAKRFCRVLNALGAISES